ncbi:unnamed protein product [Orchesella dallaii]|uniref:CCHC-type domain-containing protein n=1 Tax=Orchesella dallaii TaxID=48710 RepID=A0ABP1QRI7_9HEXA
MLANCTRKLLEQQGVKLITYKQLPGEHIQVFAFRVETAMSENRGVKIGEEILFPKVYEGLHPTIARLIKNPEITNIHQLFAVYDLLINRVPVDDPFWKEAAEQRFTPPTLHIALNTPELKIQENQGECYKCGQQGHFAKECLNARNRAVQPKKKRKRIRGFSACNRCKSLRAGLCKDIPVALSKSSMLRNKVMKK